MKWIRMLGLAMGLLGNSASAIVLAQSPVKSTQPPPGTLAEKARALREQGLEQARPKILHVAYPPIPDYDYLLTRSPLVVVATCRDSAYRLTSDGSDIETLYRFQVTEVVADRRTKPTPVKRGSASVVLPGAARLGPIGAGEIVLVQPGGVLKVDGVLFRTTYTGMPEFTLGHEYILFLKELRPKEDEQAFYGDSLVSLVYLSAGPKGCLAVSAEPSGPRVDTISDRARDLGKQVEEKFGRSKESFLAYIRAAARKREEER